MLLDKYQTTSETNINYLKKNLMEINDQEEDISKNEAASTVKQIMNTETGIIFEENIRASLEINCNFVKGNLPRDIYYKKLVFDNENVVCVIQNEPITVKIFNKTHTILFAEDRSLSIKNEGGEEILRVESEESGKNINDKKIEGKQIFIYKCKELEIDGYYRINNFKKDMFDSNEVTILYSSLNNGEEKNYEYAVIEAKLNPKRFIDLTEKIRSDDRLFKALKKKAIFIGFVNSSKVESIKKYILRGIKCVIYGINKSIFFGKKVSRAIDWDLEIKYRELNNTVNVLSNTVNSLTNSVNSLTNIVNEQNKKIENIFDYIKEQKALKENKVDNNKTTETKKEKITFKEEEDTNFGIKTQKEKVPKEEEKEKEEEEEEEEEEEIKLKTEVKKEVKKKKKEKKDEKEQQKQKGKIINRKIEEDPIISEKKGKSMKKKKEEKEIQKLSSRKRERLDDNENDN